MPLKSTGNPQIDYSTEEWIVGSDEAGYGSWAGPLTVAAVALPRTWHDPEVTDSKAFKTDKQKASRERLFNRYTLEQPVCFHLVMVSNEEIDRVGMAHTIHQAHRTALETVIQKLGRPCLKIVDGYKDGTKSIGIKGLIGLPKADTLIPSVSLASIIAKVSHDILMREYDKQYPGYGFSRHVGYGSEQHAYALNTLGACPIHRRSYSSVAKVLKNGVNQQLREALNSLDADGENGSLESFFGTPELSSNGARS